MLCVYMLCVLVYYLRQEVMFSPLFVCLSVARISQKVLVQCSCKFAGRLTIDGGPTHKILVEFG